MNRLLITGGGSYLGQHLVRLAVQTIPHEICYTYHHNDPLAMAQGRPLDVLDETAVSELVLWFRPDAIIHTVGSNSGPNVDAVIRQGTSHITHVAKLVQARLLHISTDVIFDGRNAPYDEFALPTPVNEYGRAKVAAETTVRDYENHVIIRTSLIYGLIQMDRGTSWMVKALQDGQPVKLFNNQRRNPIWIKTLCQACLELVGNMYVGTLNIAGKQVMSRAEFALKMLDWWGVSKPNTLSVGPSQGDNWSLDCELDISRATALLSTKLLGVDEVLNMAQE